MHPFLLKLPHVVLEAGKEYPLLLELSGVSGEFSVLTEIVLNGEVRAASISPTHFSEGRAEVRLQAPPCEGAGELIVSLETPEGRIEKSIPIAVADPTKRERLRVVFVWHHHQAPPLMPDGSMHSQWAIKHVVEGAYPGFSGGPYAVHIQIHERHPNIKDVDHLSPSLLETWKLVAEGRLSASPEARSAVTNTLEAYRRLASKGVIEPLSSVYAHTVQGLLLSLLAKKGLRDFGEFLLEWEHRLGLKIVEEVLGVRTRGAWTPEMFWCDGLEKIYRSVGIEYTVLCDQHLSRAAGERGDISEPYLLNGLIIFFRDRGLSDWISFMNDPGSAESADLEARRFVVALFERYLKHPGGVAVIALDGENWMFMPSTKQYAPHFLDRLYGYLEAGSQFFEVTTLRDVLRAVKPTKRLEKLPWGSWVNLSDSQWTGGVRDELWEYVIDKVSWVAGLLRAIPEDVRLKLAFDEETPVFRALLASAIAMDSDFFWYAWKEPERTVIRSWADEAERVARGELAKLHVDILRVGRDSVSLKLSSSLDYPLWVRLYAPDPSIDARVLIRPGSEHMLTIPRAQEIRVETPPVVLSTLKP